MKARIITDSACDLPAEVLNNYNIPFASLTIAFDDGTFHDGKDLTKDEFYFRLIEKKQFPKTSQPSPQAFYELIKNTLDQGLEAVVITISSNLSGTYDSANMAKNMFSEEDRKNVYIVDTLSASMGQGLLVLEACKMARNDMSGRKIAENLNRLRHKVVSCFTIDTFEYLLKGGRINKLQAVLGSMLDIKPILQITPDGKLSVTEKVRGRKKALSKLLDLFQRGENFDSKTIGLVHARAPEEIQTLAHKIKEKFGVKEVIIGEMSATIGTHTGPGCLGVFFFE